MKSSIKTKLTAILLSAVMLTSMLAGCSKDGGTDKTDRGDVTPTGKNVAKGRYVEKEFELPANRTAVCLTENEDGSIDFYSVNAEDGEGVTLHTSKDKKTWEQQPVTWHDKIKNSETGLTYTPCIIKEKSGSLLVAIMDKDRMSRIYRVVDDVATEVAMPSWDEEIKPGDDMGGSFSMVGGAEVDAEGNAIKVTKRTGISINQLIALDNGDFLTRQSSDTITRHEGKTGAEIRSYGESYSDVAVLANKLYVYDYNDGKVKVFDLETGNVDKSIEIAKGTKSPYLFSDGTEALYLAGKNGISRMVEGGSVWETVIDGGLSTLSIPSYNLRDISVGKDHSFYMLFSYKDSTKLIYSTFEKDTPTVPENELTVFALNDNDTIRQAIGEYQQANPNVMVNFKIGMDSESSATVSDVIRALNVEIVANKAPDIIILDGLPVESYIEKGVFADLTDFYAELSAKGKFIEPIATSFNRDGKINAIPARFKVPLLLGSKELTGKVNSLNDLQADFGEKPPFIETGDISEFIKPLIQSSYSAWIKPDGSLDEAKLTEFLTSTKTLYDKYKPKATNGNAMMTTFATAAFGNGSEYFEISAGSMAYMYNSSQAALLNLGSMGLLGMLIKEDEMFTAIPSIEDGEEAGEDNEPEKVNNKGGVEVIPGQSEGAFIPTMSVGITANGKQQDIAKEFLKVLFSDNVQKCSFGDGLPVTESAFNALAIMNYRDGEEEKQRELTEIKEVVKTLKTPIITDSVVLEAVTKGTTSLLKGEKDIPTTLKDIRSGLEIYLSEQG